LEVVLECFIYRPDLTIVHRLDERNRCQDAVKAVGNDLCQMEITFPTFLLNHAIDDMLSTAQENLSLQQSLNVPIFALHLQKMYAHVLGSFGMFIEKRNNFTEITHINTPFM